MSLRMQFVERAKAGEKIAALCREFGISRPIASASRTVEVKDNGNESRTTSVTAEELAPLATILGSSAFVGFAVEKPVQGGPQPGWGRVVDEKRLTRGDLPRLPSRFVGGARAAPTHERRGCGRGRSSHALARHLLRIRNGGSHVRTFPF